MIPYNEIENALSTERFGTYLSACNNDISRACQLYRWNTVVSGAFMPWLSIVEIILRNRIHLVLSRIHGNGWPWCIGFERTLPQNMGARSFDPLGILQKNRNKHQRSRQTSKVIANLNFAFWHHLLKQNYTGPIWNNNLYIAFPNLSTNQNVSVLLRSLQNKIENIRELRNRIAHHEPIFQRNLVDDYASIIQFVSSCHSQDFLDWLQKDISHNRLGGNYLDFILQEMP